MKERMQPIRPELLAVKMEKIMNFEQPKLFDEFSAEPRLVEALWFLQYVSLPQNYAGGLSKFAADFISQTAGDTLGTAHVLKAGGVARYEVGDAVTILHELPQWQRSKLFGDDAWIFENAFRRGSRDHKGGRVRVTKESGSRLYWKDPSDGEEETWEGSRRGLEQRLLAQLTPAAVRELCCEAAREELSEYLKQVCESPHIGFRRSELGNGAPWYFASIANALLQFMERRSEAMRATLADTEVTRLVLRWMDKARRMKRPIMISGNSRFGKTEAVKLFSAMNPGACRLIETPATNAIGDLLREVAKSLGIEVGPQNSGRELRERIDYVLRFSPLLLCFDEAQFIIPVAYSRNTAPARLNWVRRSVIDRNIAAVFICTPQSYPPAKKRFEKATGFAMEQFDERLLKTVELPKELSEADLLAVARIHFPGLRDEYLHFVVDEVLATERNFVSDIEKITTLAKDNASENGRKVPILDDVKAAMADVLPTRNARRETQPQIEPSAKPVQPPCTASAGPMQTDRNTFSNFRPENRRETVVLQT